MEETLGKRIVAQRKRLGLTQDRLAELLGVTAQAISKWENDQSCPDIAMLPKLAETFGITTDELLGIERKEVRLAEVVTKEAENDADEPNGLHLENGTWELKWDGGRKSSVGFAVWVLLVGSILLAMHFNWPRFWNLSLWELLWTTALFVFGLFGLYPKFSLFRLGCAFFGGYFLLDLAGFLSFNMGMSLILPIVLLLFGISLLLDALRKPKDGSFHLNHNGRSLTGPSRNYCSYNGGIFDCNTSFGENDYHIQLPRLSGGTANVSFGEMTVDLSACEEIAENCHIELNCSFGELEFRIPRRFRAEPATSTAFASVETQGSPAPDASATLFLDCSVSFGEITIRYI